jgi:hypothetical protein
MSSLLGIYAGLVEENRDPEKLGRLKVRIPVVYGPPGGGSSGSIGTDDLPWAFPVGMPAGGSNASGGISWLPEVGDQVMAMFLDGEPEKPVWFWSMQTLNQAQTLKLHHHETDIRGVVGKPDRAILTRYGHSVELSASSLISTTSQGYRVTMIHGDNPNEGELSLATPKGQILVFDDLNEGLTCFVNRDHHVQIGDAHNLQAASVNIEARDGPMILRASDAVALQGSDLLANIDEDVVLNVGKSCTLMVGAESSVMLTVADGKFTLTTGSGATFAIDEEGNIAVATPDGTNMNLEDGHAELATSDGTSITAENGKVTVNAQDVMVNGGNVAFGQNAAFTVALAEKLATLFNTHIHGNGNEGSPTTPPVTPIFPNEFASTKLLSE